MSNAALAIWISSGSLLLSAGSLVVSVAAYKRSMCRRPDRLSELNRYIAEIRPRLNQLERAITEAVRSRARASAASVRPPRVAEDTAAIREPRGRLDKAAWIHKRVDYIDTETTKSVTALQAGTRLEQLVEYMRNSARRPK